MVRLLDPRVSCRVAFDSPKVKPSGENMNRRGGPARDTRMAEGPSSDQNGADPLYGKMLSEAESIESTNTWPRAMARSRAR